MVGRGLLRSEDGGRSWSAFGAQVPEGVHALAVAPGTPEVVYIGTMSQGVLVSRDSGRTWAPAGLQGGMVASLSFQRKTGMLFATTQDGVMMSRNGGQSWEQVAPPGTMLAAAEDRPEVILAIDGEGRVVRSGDGGRTWTSLHQDSR